MGEGDERRSRRSQGYRAGPKRRRAGVTEPAEGVPGSRGRRSGKTLGAFMTETGKLREVYRFTRLF